MGILLAFGLIGALFAAKYFTGFAGSDHDIGDFYRQLAARAALERASFLGDGGHDDRRFAVIRQDGPGGSFGALPARFLSVGEAEQAIRAAGGGVSSTPGSAVRYYVFDVGSPISVIDGPGGGTTHPVLIMFMRA